MIKIILGFCAAAGYGKIIVPDAMSLSIVALKNSRNVQSNFACWGVSTSYSLLLPVVL